MADMSIKERQVMMDENELDRVRIALRSLDIQALLTFLDNHSDCLHLSRYHREDYPTHCLIVIYRMIREFLSGKVSEAALVAACLHDIAKPRTAGLNKRNEACFYGHENVTDEEVGRFLALDYPEFQTVVALIRAHMLPFGVRLTTPEPFRSKNQERLRAILDGKGKSFELDLATLSACDESASVRDDADLNEAEDMAQATHMLLIHLLD